MSREKLAQSGLSQTRVLNETRVNQDLPEVASKQACLIFIAGDRIGKKIDLEAAELTIGRDPRCDLAINSDLVSRNHAKLRVAGETTQLVDLDSTNGTFVNDQRIRSRTLVDGDRVAIGKVVMKYLAPGNAEAGYHDEVYRLMSYDGLTDVYNKRFFEEHLKSETSRGHGDVSVIVLDADHFKSVNDTYGHSAGDAVLRQLAECARQNVRDGLYLARVGGEEFSILCPGISAADAAQIGEAIRKTVEEHQFRFGDLTIPVTVSVGVASLASGQEGTGEDLFKRADSQLYRAKESGRNQVCS